MQEGHSIRKPAVAGAFYPADSSSLQEMIENLRTAEKSNITTELANSNIIGGVVPHAGYIYSGYEAVHFFELVRLSEKEIETVIILNPDHQGFGPAYAASPSNYWETPLGKITIDKELAEFFPQSEIAHRNEHSAEVMLPFIQEILGNKINILPIAIGSPTPDTAKELAELIYKVVKETNRKVVIIASSDFSHYVKPKEGEELDNLVLDRIFDLDSTGVYQTIRKNGITVCGYGPIMTLIEYSLLCSKFAKVSIAARGNSGKNSKASTVVDYITILFTT